MRRAGLDVRAGATAQSGHLSRYCAVDACLRGTKKRRLASTLLVVVAFVLGGCATPLLVEPSAPVLTLRAGQILGRNDRFLIYVPASNETLRTIARRFLGNEERYGMIGDMNGIKHARAGQPVVVPLQPINPTGVSADGYQTVPILCYHRFGSRDGKMTVTPENFAAQMEYLARKDYRVVRLSDLVGFLEGKRPLPKRAVVITIDDGYASAYRHAFAVLKKHGFPATMFLYPEFVGSKDAVTWVQLQEMVDSGLVEVQAHSMSHTNLTLRIAGETDERYRERIDNELRTPRAAIERKLPVQVASYAYPYGDASEVLLDRLMHAGYRLGVTVNPGGNPFFSHPLLLRRTMIFGEHDLDAFKSRLQVFRELDLR